MSPNIEAGTAKANPAETLLVQRECFLRNLRDQGYAVCTLRTYDTAISRFGAAIGELGIRASRLDVRRSQPASRSGVKLLGRIRCQFDRLHD